jgi:hypothetical protein
MSFSFHGSVNSKRNFCVINLRKAFVDYVIEAVEMPIFQALNALIKRLVPLFTVKF